MRRDGRKKVRAGGRHSGTPVRASAGLRNCAVTQEGLRPSCGTRRNRTSASRLYGFCGSDNGPDNPCCYLASLLPAYIYILLRWIFRRRFFRCRIIRRRKCQQRQKRARHVYSCLALYHPYRAEAGVIVQTSKVVNR